MIYPPFEKGFEGDNAKWHYMNGGVSPILAGELARGAFNCGREAYGADLVKRLLTLVEANGNHVHATFTGNTAPRTLPAFRTLALRTFANVDTAGTGDASVPRWTGEGVNDFHQFKGGAIHVDRVPVELIDPETNARRACVGLSTGRAGFARSVTVPVGHACGTVYFTHTCAKSPASNVVGCFEAKYDDGTVHREYVIRGQHVRGWWYPTDNTDQRQTHLRVAWTGSNSRSTEVGLCTWAWRNPHPTKVLKELLLEPAAESSSPIAAWIVFGITTADRWYPFDDSPVSYGIPDNWAAAAVMYALIEGLAGIVDLGTKLDDVDISPKWSFTGDESAEVCVCYPQSGGYVAYHWRRQDDTVHLTLCGSGNGATLRVPLLESETVFMDGNEYPDPVIQTIGDTQYIEVCVPLRGVVELIIG